MTQATDKMAKDDLKAIIASVGYLEGEAKKAGFEDVSNILRKAIAETEKLLKGQGLNGSDYLPHLVDSELHKILTLLLEFSGMEKFDLQSILDTIEHYDNIRKKSHFKDS